MRAPVVVGVDNGGTWIRLKGLDAHGRCVWSLQKPSPSVDKLPHFLKKHLGRFRGALSGLAVGSRGVWKRAKRQEIKHALHGLAKYVVVMSDVEAAWLGAFDPGGEGIVVISGTGSIAYGRKADGTFARAGGLGPKLGDEGSGYWIAKSWLGKVPAATPVSVRRIAALAPDVIRLARQRNPQAQHIIRAAQKSLAQLAADVQDKLHVRKIKVSCSGSVFSDKGFRNGFWNTLRPRKVLRASARRDAPTALALSIMGHAPRL